MRAQNIIRGFLLFSLAVLTSGEVKLPVYQSAEPLSPADGVLGVSDIPGSDPREIVASGSPFPSLGELLAPAPLLSRTSPLSAGEAARICRAPAWALTPENWIFSGAKEFLDAYTVATDGSYARKQYGLVGSLAYHYLGEENFRCSIGMMQTCEVSCKDIVMAVEDLEEARLVYFVMSSVSHFAAVANLVHVSIFSSLHIWIPFHIVSS